ncbi:MAG TPA: NmrA family NAD(P)-binding protein [Flavipsychrobacter sp.]|nr:NmrA family NAD(P)-binding protein [Flavipsychrobacter sp.]
MNIVITGSLGHISKPLTQEIVQKGHSVTVISSKTERIKEIEAIGATAAIGSVLDAAFLTDIFKKADMVYLMEPPANFFDHSVNMEVHWMNIAMSYVQAVQQSGVTRIIHLSSIGAHTDKGVGMLAAHYHVENTLKQLPANVSIKFMRPVGFYYNMLAFIPAIRNAGTILQNYGGDEKEPWVSPLDIAAVIAAEMEKPFEGHIVRYIASDEVSPNEVANKLGKAIGKPDLEWRVIPDEQFLQNLVNAGFHPQAAKGLTAMNAGRRNQLYDDYNQNKPVLGEVKLDDFAKEFAAAYQS